MFKINNKPLAILVVVNIIAFMIIFWLIGLLMGRGSSEIVMQPVARDVPVLEQQIKEQQVREPAPIPPDVTIRRSVAEIDQPAVPIATSIEQVVGESAPEQGSAGPDKVAQTHTVDVYYEDGIVRLEESDGSGNTNVLISNSLEEMQKLNPDDARYIEALQKLKQGSSQHVSLENLSEEDAIRYRARNVDAMPEVDRFNKVDVSMTRVPRGAEQALTIAQQIDAIIVAEEVADSEANSKTVGETVSEASSKYQWPSQQNYVKTLDAASLERANETRTIKVKRGDSLWLIAVRAYGSGFLYPRIYRANPHLKNPNMIREGEILRVPL